MDLRLFKLSINPFVIDKPSRNDSINQALDWRSVQLDIDNIIKEVQKGRAFSAQFKGGHRKSSNFICSDVIAVDIDRGMLIDDALTNPYISSNASFLYSTPSHRENEHRFRIVFLLDTTITSSEDWKNALRGAGRKLGGDPSIKDAARQFYGSKKGMFHRFGNILGDLEVQHLVNLGEELKKGQNNRQLGARGSIRGNSSILNLVDLKISDGRILPIQEIKPSTSVFCPVHLDKNSSAFTVKSKNGAIGVHCSSCSTTYWHKEPNRYDFNALDKWVEGIKEIDDPLSVSNRLESPFPKAIQIEKFSSQFLPPIKYRNGITCVKSPKGSGKTQALVSLVNTVRSNSDISKRKFPDKPRSVLLIGHRQTLLREAAAKLSLTCYLDDKNFTDFYAVCLDSLPSRFEHSKKIYDVILIDESEQVLQHLLSDTVAKGVGIERCWNVLSFMLRKAKSVIALDADLSLMTVHALRFLRPNDWDDNFSLVYNKPENSAEQSKSFDLYDDRSHLVDELVNSVNLGKRCFVTANSKKFIQSLNEAIREKSQRELKILEVTSDNSSDDDIVNFVRNIKSEILKYDVVLASPSLGTGIDISFPEQEQKIDEVFGYFEALINTHLDIDQQIARVRNPKSIKIWISSRRERFETNFDVVLNDVASAYAVKGAMKGYDDDGNLIFDKTDPLLQIYTHIICSQRASHLDIQQNFLELKVSQGWTINSQKKDVSQSNLGQSAYASGKQNRIQKRISNILLSRDLSEAEATELLIKRHNNEFLSLQERYSLEKSILEKSFKTKITADLISRNEDNKLIERVVLFKHIENNLRLPHGDNIFDYFVDEFIDNKKPKKWGLKTGKPHTLSLMFKSVGFLSKNGFDKNIKIEQSHLKNMTKFLSYNKIAIEEAFGFGLRGDFKSNPVRQLNVFLGLIGLSMERDNKKMFKGSVSYYYKLNPKSLKFMTDISTNFNLFDIEHLTRKNGFVTKSGNPNFHQFIRFFKKI